MKNHLIILFAFAISLSILASCKKKDKKKQRADNPISGNFSSQQTIKFDSTQIAIFIKKYQALASLKAEIDTFYHGRAYYCAWFDEKGVIEQAENLYNHTQNIDSEGLPDKSVYKKEFMALMENPALDKSKKADIETELMLTAQYFVYAKNVWVL